MRGEEIRAARTLLGWTKTDLAERARINRRTVANIEAGKHAPSQSVLLSIQRAFAAAGIEFVDGGPTLRAPLAPSLGRPMRKQFGPGSADT
jgi:transcriptional regulator with XRE-family HTH domain